MAACSIVEFEYLLEPDKWLIREGLREKNYYVGYGSATGLAEAIYRTVQN